MIKVILEIKVKNHDELAQKRGGILGTIYSKIASDFKGKVEDRICKEISVKISKEVEKGLAAEGVAAKVKASAFVMKRKNEVADNKK